MNEFHQPKLSSSLALLVILWVFNGSAKRIAAGAEPAAKSVEGVSEEAQDAIVELAEAGVQVLLGKYEVNGRQWIDDDEETDWEEVEEDAARKLVRATFRTPGASVSEPGFRATFTRKALAQLLRNLPDLASADLRGTNVTDDHLKQLSNWAKNGSEQFPKDAVNGDLARNP